MAKILIGVPTHKGHKHCVDEFVEGLKKSISADILFVVNNGESAYATFLRSKGLNAIENPEKTNERFENIVSHRNYIRKHALKNGYDYLFFVDSDVILPANALDTLLAAKKDIISGAYLNAFKLNGQTVIAPVLFKDMGKGEAQLYTYDGMYPARVIEIGAGGLGCCLIKRNVLDIPFRLMPSGKGEDIAFYLDAREKGYAPYAHTGVRCIHRGYPKEHELASVFEWTTNIEQGRTQIDLSKLGQSN